VSDRLRTNSQCPDLADLLLATDKELPKRRQNEIDAHLRSCALCRDRVGDAILAIREYRDSASEAPILAPTERLFADFRERLQQEQRARLRREVRIPTRHWLPVAAAALLALATFFFSSRYSSVVEAEELLSRAEVREQTAATNTVRRLEIRVRRPRNTDGGKSTFIQSRAPGSSDVHLFTRTVGRTATVNVPPVSADEAELAQLFEHNHFLSQDPLRARGFREWRASLTTKTDRVTAIGDELSLQTTTPEGTLRGAELIVDRLNFEPLRASWDFKDFGQVEIIEVAHWTAPSAVPEKPAFPTTVERGPANSDVLEEAELDVRIVLHQLAVDWNPEIVLVRAGRAVEVRGAVGPEDRATISLGLRDVAHVRVAVHANAGAAGDVGLGSEDGAFPKKKGPERQDIGADESPSTVPSSTPRSPLTQWLARTFGASDRAGTFLAELTARSEDVHRRSAAFAALARRYPEAERLPRTSQSKLDQLVEAHYRDLVGAVDALDTELTIFLGTGTRMAPGRSAPRPWQPRAHAAAAVATRVSEAVQTLLRHDDLPLPTEIASGREPAVLRDVRRVLDELWQSLLPGN